LLSAIKKGTGFGNRNRHGSTSKGKEVGMKIKKERGKSSKNISSAITDEALLFIIKRIFSENTLFPQPQCIYIAQQYFKQLLDFSATAHLPKRAKSIKKRIKTNRTPQKKHTFESVKSAYSPSNIRYALEFNKNKQYKRLYQYFNDFYPIDELQHPIVQLKSKYNLDLLLKGDYKIWA